MRNGLRFSGIALWTIALAVFGLSALVYVVYAASGILDELEAQDRRERNDRVIMQTATALPVRLTKLAQPTATATPTLTATITPTVTFTATASVTATQPPSPTSSPTITPVPTNTSRPTFTPVPTNTPRSGATATVPVGIINTPVPTPAGN